MEMKMVASSFGDALAFYGQDTELISS
jgi:hypothetical protein